MTNGENSGFLGRRLAALGGALGRALLGKSAHSYMKQFTGSADYWDRVLAAQRGWPRERLAGSDGDRFGSPVNPGGEGGGTSPLPGPAAFDGGRP
jgi:hypothetical protein